MSQGEKNEMTGVLKYMKSNGSLKIVVVAILIGIGLIAFGGKAFTGDGRGEEEESEIVPSISYLEYKRMLEYEIVSLCLSVEGVSGARAVVFFDSVGGSLYAQNVQSGGNTEKSEYVIIGSGSSSSALYLGESLPKLSGIGVVCDTGGSVAKQNELAALLSSAYGLSLTRVYVAEGEG